VDFSIPGFGLHAEVAANVKSSPETPLRKQLGRSNVRMNNTTDAASGAIVPAGGLFALLHSIRATGNN